MMITLTTHIETEKKQSSVKTANIGSCWTRRDVFLDMLDKRGIPFTDILENAAFFRQFPHLVPSMLKILNPCYDCDGFMNPRNSYYSNSSLAKKEQMIGSVMVKFCSERTIKRHKSLLQSGRQLTLVERHSFKKRTPKHLNTDGIDLLDDPRTTMCLPSDFYLHFTSAVDWHKTMRECSELFSQEISDLISYEHFEEISFDTIENNKFRGLYGVPRYTTTLSSSSNEEGTYEGPLFFRAKRKKNGELRKPRSSRLLISPARQSSLGGSSGKLGIAGRSFLAFEGRNEVKPGLHGGVDPGVIHKTANKSPETPRVGLIGVDPTQTTAKQKQASETPLKTSIQKQKSARVKSKQEIKPLKFAQMPDILSLIHI